MASESAQTKHKYFEDQFDDEEVEMVFRKHPIVMRKGFIIGMLMWLVGPVVVLILTFVHPDAPPSIPTFFASLAGSIVLGIIAMIPSWIGWYFSVYIVTDQRFIQITQKGLFTRSVVDIALNQIQMINYEIVGLQETLLGFGTIRVQTYVGELVIHDVHHPANTAKKLQLVLRDLGVMTATLQQ
ncbi:hypothetical protein BH09PAT4_BH09PAT4_08350 [soil metagenome]|jgi:uncharacterized integral membrane protein